MVVISRQRDINQELGSYLDGRRGTSGSSNFFKKVESMIPKMKSSENVPQVNDLEPTVVEQKKRPLFWFLFPQKPKVDEPLEDLSEDEMEELVEAEHELEEIDHEVEELEEQRESLLQKIFSFFGSKRQQEFEEDDDETVPVVEPTEQDMKDQETQAVLKIVHKWISRLPPEQIDAFKRSPDFQRYKKLLEMYHLIK